MKISNGERKKQRFVCVVVTLMTGSLLAASTSAAYSQSLMPAPIYLNQGAQWTDAQRQAFYTQDQGSTMIPLAWLKALKTEKGEPFLGDELARYGYLPNPNSRYGLPVGFTVNGNGPDAGAGMSCAACHTRQIAVGATSYRIDGGPAIVDFQSLLVDLVGAVGRVIDCDKDFEPFANAVLGQGADKNQRVVLRGQVEVWYAREKAMIDHALPIRDLWGLGRLDAVSMIFNRLSGLDLGPAPTYLIESNIHPADAPVRYPFLWNAAIQDKTQWPGFADNGNNLLGLARNTGEVYGVFATFHPSPLPFGFVNFNAVNSANWQGLAKLENMIALIGPPAYPGKVDTTLAKLGEQVYNWKTDKVGGQGGCVECHGETKGAFRSLTRDTWATPIQDVGTDSREYDILTRTTDTGVLANTRLYPGAQRMPQTGTTFSQLGYSVVGSLLQGGLAKAYKEMNAAAGASPNDKGPTSGGALSGAFQAQTQKNGTNYAYESRVMHGIWAAAPYLHNGSVPTLADLLSPENVRPTSFALGSEYDLNTLGLAKVQPGSTAVRTVTPCAQRNSGNSNCGHPFGTNLPPKYKLALLEYLKVL